MSIKISQSFQSSLKRGFTVNLFPITCFQLEFQTRFPLLISFLLVLKLALLLYQKGIGSPIKHPVSIFIPLQNLNFAPVGLSFFFRGGLQRLKRCRCIPSRRKLCDRHYYFCLNIIRLLLNRASPGVLRCRAMRWTLSIFGVARRSLYREETTGSAKMLNLLSMTTLLFFPYIPPLYSNI